MSAQDEQKKLDRIQIQADELKKRIENGKQLLSKFNSPFEKPSFERFVDFSCRDASTEALLGAIIESFNKDPSTVSGVEFRKIAAIKEIDNFVETMLKLFTISVNDVATSTVGHEFHMRLWSDRFYKNRYVGNVYGSNKPLSLAIRSDAAAIFMTLINRFRALTDSLYKRDWNGMSWSELEQYIDMMLYVDRIVIPVDEKEEITLNDGKVISINKNPLVTTITDAIREAVKVIHKERYDHGGKFVQRHDEPYKKTVRQNINIIKPKEGEFMIMGRNGHVNRIATEAEVFATTKYGRAAARSVKEISREPVKEISREPVKEVSKEPVKEVSKEPVKEVSKEPVKEVSKEPVKEVSKEQAIPMLIKKTKL